MITVSINGEVALWDAQNMQICQVAKNTNYMQTNTISTSFFSKDAGMLILATKQSFEVESLLR
jgi:hypothetical protein